jgi:glutamyl-tRNA synthetase
MAATLDELVKKYAEQKQLGLGKVAQPLRVAVTGTTISPPIFESLEMLGREHTLARIDRCLAGS